MMNAPLWLYIAAMAVVTYLIRAVPFVFFRRQIKSRFVKSLLYYLPYAVLAAMTVPDIFSSTGNPLTAARGFLTAVVFALMKKSLIIVALAASCAAFLCDLALRFLV